jgi:phospholipase/carboxylesterase
MARPLDGPRIVPRGGKPSALVVLLHGYGANGDDLIAVGDAWRRSLPDFVFVAPNAPEMIPGMHGGLPPNPRLIAFWIRSCHATA